MSALAFSVLSAPQMGQIMVNSNPAIDGFNIKLALLPTVRLEFEFDRSSEKPWAIPRKG